MDAAAEYVRFRAALGDTPLPAAFVDLDAFDHNLEHLLEQAASRGKQIRLASKSVRCAALLHRAVDRAGGRIVGIMAYTVTEAAHLVGHGFANIFVAYPTVQPSDARALVELNAGNGARVAVVVDDSEQLARLGAVAASAGGKIPVVVDVDLSLRWLGAHIGVRRSPLREPAAVLDLVRQIVASSGLSFCGVMGYEAQVAGLTDANPFTPLMNPLKGLVRSRSVPEAARRRGALAAALDEAGFACHLYNGGGTGSVATTAADGAVTEVAAGSGLLCGHLFDYYRDLELQPAAFFALQVVRRPAPGFVTCHGGGYVASGEPGRDRLPRPVLPAGLTLTALEAAGEVQTPLRVPAGVELAIGDPVFFRHAKSGELAEHFNHLVLVRGEQIVDRVPTYRGEGKAFL